MKTVEAFVISATNRTFTLRYRDDDGQSREVPYASRNGEEDVRLHNAMASLAIVRIEIEGDTVVLLP